MFSRPIAAETAMPPQSITATSGRLIISDVDAGFLRDSPDISDGCTTIVQDVGHGYGIRLA